jgi:hypothetical protein
MEKNASSIAKCPITGTLIFAGIEIFQRRKAVEDSRFKGGAPSMIAHF